MINKMYTWVKNKMYITVTTQMCDHTDVYQSEKQESEDLPYSYS